jgi:hemerythrin superfamily protein
MDALQLLKSQHDEVERAFAEYESLGAGSEERQKELARSVIKHLSIHAAIEEQAFYPTVREAMPELDQEIQHDLEEHRRAKEELAELDGSEPGSKRFDELFRSVTADIRHHVQEEENDLFPKVRQGISEQELADLGNAMQQLQSAAPTRPHPRAPDQPPANVIAGPGAALVDRIRDAIRSRLGKGTV